MPHPRKRGDTVDGLVALRWPAVVLLAILFALCVAWSTAMRWLDLRQRDQALDRREIDIQHIEKMLALRQQRLEQEVSKAVKDQTIERTKARLRRETAEANAAAALAKDPELQEARKASEYRVIGAMGDARVRLAEEFARAEHKKSLEQHGGLTVEQAHTYWIHHLAGAKAHGGTKLSLPEFLATIAGLRPSN